MRALSPLSRRAALLAAIASALAGASCGGSSVTGATVPHLAALAAARERWSARGIDSYDWVVERGWCECLPEWTRPLYVEVRDGVVRTVLYAETRQAVASTHATPRTVEEFFALVEETLAQNPYRFTARYDPTYGFPTFMQVDYDQQMVDDEFMVEAKDFVAR